MISKAPVLELHMIVVRAAYEGSVEERVVRGRKRHLVEMRIDFRELEALEPDERRLLALPAVLEGVSRAQQALKLSGEHPEIPDSVRPAPLSAGTLRRRSLRELRGQTNAPTAFKVAYAWGLRRREVVMLDRPDLGTPDAGGDPPPAWNLGISPRCSPQTRGDRLWWLPEAVTVECSPRTRG
jgi:hypothetical protein